MKRDLGNEKISVLLLDQSVPAILSMLVAAIYNLVDRMFIGRINSLGLTAIGITMPFQIVQMAFVLLIGVGGSTLISIKYGEGKIKSAENILINSFIFFIITELLVTILCLIFINPIFSLLGVSNNVYGLAKDYIVVMLLGGIPGLTGYCLNNTVRSLGFSRNAMTYVLLSSVLNIILDAIFIFIFGWGVKGAAIATVISQTLVTIFVLGFFIKSKGVPIKLRLNNLKVDFRVVKEVFSNGLPSFYMQVVGTVVGILLNRFIISYGGDYHLASITIISSIGLFFSMFYYGVSQGAQPIIGYNFGAGKIERSIKTVYLTLIFITFISILFMIVLELFPEFLVKFFTKDSGLIKLTVYNIKIYLLGLPFIGIHSISTTYFISIKKPRISSLLNILKFGGIIIPLLYILPNFFGINGVYISNALSDTISGIIAFVLLYIQLKNTRKEQNTL
ncbi:MATE family efflux transporter [Peptostreptococcus canis]|uniref:Multidrug export protein MepA n=1 Tax=Peptostreptococcus canis TaxID=1159213 RepID=A0ABR6TJZ4_9FIRM|nr:MATE family efflux transporter [Peptostreptococcus canis]MBC2575729.1 MATE family efflux transporter [Peptostreptococcus canis]MBP1998156.1 putative MATE family efflux protein [Peptostreptococcus canis]